MNDDTPTPPEPRPAPPVDMGFQPPPADKLPPPEPAYGMPIVDLNGGPVVRRPWMLLALLLPLLVPVGLGVLWLLL